MPFCWKKLAAREVMSKRPFFRGLCAPWWGKSCVSLWNRIPNWLLAVGYWLLAIGFWLFGVGFWVMVVGDLQPGFVITEACLRPVLNTLNY